MRAIASREEVVLACEQAIAHGVTPGMTVANARALLGGSCTVHTWQHDPEADQAALHRLAAWATRFAPLVMADPDDDADSRHAAQAMPGLLADISGCERLYRGEANLLLQLHDAVRQLGFHARIASAPTIGCAWAVARFGEDDITIVESGGVRDATHALPLRGLRLDADMASACSDIGVSTLGQLLDLPRSSLPSRFGSDVIIRIDQMLGHGMETITPIRPRPPLSVTQQFNGPVKQLEAIELTTQQLLSELCEQMLHRESGARQLDLVLERSDCAPYPIKLSVSRFNRNSRHLWSLLRPHLERAHLGFGVESITLTASRVSTIAHHQQTHHAIATENHIANTQRELAQTIDTLSSRLGSQNILHASLIESHLPELAVRFNDAMLPASKHVSPATHAAHRFERPPVLLPTPRAVEVMSMSPDGPLVQMKWNGELLRLSHTIGPERVIGPWWQSQHIVSNARDYFKVQDERGRWWWVFRQTDTHRWFIHGGWV